jgi:hypothetical protein
MIYTPQPLESGVIVLSYEVLLYRPIILSLEHVIASSDLLRNRPYGVISMLPQRLMSR